MLRRWLNSGAGAISSIWVKNGASWDQIWYTNYTTDSAWTLVNLDISQYADGNPALQIRLRQQGALGSTHASGWNVDRFVVKTGSTPDFDACGACGGAPTFGGVIAAQDLHGCADTGVALSWSAAPAWGTGRAGSYAIYRDTNPNFVPSPGNLVADGITGTSYTDSMAPNGVPLYYIVRAESDETCSAGPNNGGMVDANLVRAAVRDDLTQPAPGDVGESLRMDEVNDAHARLAWGAATGAASYRVFHSQAPPGTFTQFASIPALYYEDLNQMANGTTWYYLVRAADSCGNVGP
jgi:hypothetical protein